MPFDCFLISFRTVAQTLPSSVVTRAVCFCLSVWPELSGSAYYQHQLSGHFLNTSSRVFLQKPCIGFSSTKLHKQSIGFTHITNPFLEYSLLDINTTPALPSVLYSNITELVFPSMIISFKEQPLFTMSFPSFLTFSFIEYVHIYANNIGMFKMYHVL